MMMEGRVGLSRFYFCCGSYLPGRAKLTNTVDMIRLIIRDEAVHDYCIGYKFQRAAERPPEVQR